MEDGARARQAGPHANEKTATASDATTGRVVGETSIFTECSLTATTEAIHKLSAMELEIAASSIAVDLAVARLLLQDF